MAQLSDSDSDVVDYCDADQVGQYAHAPVLPQSPSPGVTLDQWLRTEQPTPWESARLVAALAEAVESIHQGGMAPGPIAPEFIRISPAGEPRLAFPHVRKPAKPLNTPGDILALGLVLYRLLTGKPPAKKNPRKALGHVPTDLQAICLKAIANDPAQRYASATAFAQALRDFLAKHPEPTTQPRKGFWK